MLKMNITNLKNHSKELIVFLLFSISVITISTFHEPWFDEFQAWAISKDSLYNILFVHPHFEGHSPLWWLILKCFSFFNINVEWGLKIPNLLFMISAVALLIFKSPFPNIVKFTLPFTYFIFYQYSVISRPYSIFCFALFLCATLYKNRNTNPFKFISSLALLCLSCAYGMVISTGIILAWLIEIFKDSSLNLISFVKTFLKDKRFFSMLIIFFICLLLAIELLPDKNAFAMSTPLKKDYVVKFLYSFFGITADATFFDFYNYKQAYNLFSTDISLFFKHYNNPLLNNYVLNFWIACIIGFIINTTLIITFKKENKLLFFLIPYVFLLFTFFILYTYCHHIGLIFCFFIFVFWHLYENNTDLQTNNKIIIPFIVLTIFIQLIWCTFSSYIETIFAYDNSRYLAKYIKTYNLDRYKIMSYWMQREFIINKQTKKINFMDNLNSKADFIDFYNNNTYIHQINLQIQPEPVSVNSYFNKNIFYTFNINNPHQWSLTHKNYSKEEYIAYKLQIQKLGLPDIIIGRTNIDSIFDNLPYKPSEKYILLQSFPKGMIYKLQTHINSFDIFIRKDLYDVLKENKMIE